MSTRPIYLDYQATTPVDPRVVEAMLPYLTTEFGNPSSAHAYGRTAAAVDTARAQVAALIGAREPQEIVFTACGTESNHLALTGTAHALRAAGPELAFSAQAACHTGRDAPSAVLTAIGLTPDQAARTIRLGIGRFSDIGDIDRAVDVLTRALATT
jgi:cysteine sulfinate desulfinase/cysteine desulfurase-like protein